jgi:PAS domain S-box-containing protein
LLSEEQEIKVPDSSRSEKLSDIGVITAMVLGLYLTCLYGYLLFHSLVEITTIAIGFTLFILTWNTRRFLANNFLSILGIGYTFIALIDLLHTLAYKGMSVFPGFDANLPTQLWIAARYLQAVTLCAAPFFMERRVNNRAIIGAYAAAVSVLVTLVFSGNFPACYVEGKGLTTFKIGSEYLITVLILTSLYLFYRERKHFNDRVFFLIVSSIVCTAVSEISFTAYVSVYGFANMIGHFSKLAAFYLIYRAILVTGLKEPFDLIFRELKQAQEALRKDQDILEDKIRERTAELQLANERLQQELAERERAEEALRRYSREIQDLYDHAPCGYHSLDSDGTIIRINDTELKWLGYTRDEVLGKMRFSDIITERSLQSFREEFPRFMEQGWHRDLEYEMVRRDGTILPVLMSATAIYDDGHYLMSRSTIYDITERRKAEDTQHRLNRELRAISDCNQLLVRAEDEQTLLNEVCRIIGDEAGYRMAWVGYAGNDDARTVGPVAWGGVEEGYLADADITWAEMERGLGPSGTTLRTGKTSCIQDFATEPKAAPWRDSALQRGYRSSIALPLKDAVENTFGVLTIYSTKTNAFTADEIRLLEEMSGNLAFGIMFLRARKERERAEASLHKLTEVLEQRVSDRTAELEKKNEELELMNRLFVGRELRMVELKTRIQELETRLGET